MGLFDTILGPSFLGLSGSSSETEQKLDPTTQALNAFRLSQLRSGNAMTGGLGALLSNLQASGGVSQDTLQQLQNAVAVANTPGMNYDQWYGNAYGGLQPGTQTQQLLDYYGGTNQNVLNQQQQALANQGNTLAAGLGYSNDLYSMLGQQARGDIGQQQQALGGLYDSINQALQQGTAGQRDYLGNYYGNAANTLQGLQGNALNQMGNYYQNVGNNLNQLQDNTLNQLGNYYQNASNNLGQMQNNTLGVLNNQYSGAQGVLGNLLNQGSDYLSNYYNQVSQNINNQLSPDMFNAGSKYYQMIMGPQIGNDYSLMGLGRSGARTQAENIAGASVGSQIAQTLAQLQQQGYLQQGQQQANLRGQINQLQGGLLGQQANQYGDILGNYSNLQAGLLGQQGQQQGNVLNTFNSLLGNLYGQQGSEQANLLNNINQLQGGLLTQQGQEQAGLSSQLLGNQANLYGQQANQYGSLAQQLNSLLGQYGLGQTSQAGSLFNNYMGNIGNINQGYSGLYNQNQQQAGQGLQNLNTQYLNNLYGLNQAAPGVFTNLRSADLARAGQGINYSDYARQVASGTAGNMLNSYLSAINSTPYTPAGTTSKTGNEGLLNTAFGAGMGQAAGAAIGSDINIKVNLEEFNSKEFLDKLKAYTYNYIKEVTNHPNLKQAGIIAQDLENTELGKDYVITSDKNIKYIDYSRMLSLMMACIVSLNSRISELENSNSKE